MRYCVGGRIGATGGAGEVIAQLWNPHASLPLRVAYVAFAGSGGASPADALVQRTTARGTPGSTTTPDADAAANRRASPPSGALLDLSDFTVNATVDASVLRRWTSSGVVAAGFDAWHHDGDRFGGIIVPAGTGLALVATAAWTAAGDATFWWDE